ncbi:hypothetical protein LCGC14_2557690, partial [marine sediment metagenome]
MGRRRSRARPGRKSGIKCDKCHNTLGKFHNHNLCNECQGNADKIDPIEKELKTMHI